MRRSARSTSLPETVLPAPGRSGAAAAALDTTDHLIAVIQQLSLTRQLEQVMVIVRAAARELTGADGASFILRDRDQCFYADEDAVAPLWKGRRFPISACVSGWAMIHREQVVIEDIYADDRVPQDAYRPTFVKSLALVPIRTEAPIGALGVYWAHRHHASPVELKLLQALANSTSIAIHNAELLGELQARIAESRRAVSVRDEFLSVASHELRTPLTAVKLQLESLLELMRRDPGAIEPRLQERVDRAMTSTNRLASLVESLLDVSRSALGRLALKPEPLELRELVREVLEQFEDQARRAGCQLQLLPGPPLQGHWDRDRLGQVLTQLLANSIKYGAGKPIELRLEASPELALISILDQGIGIAAEQLPFLFERFARAAPLRNYGGLGLGLYICRTIVEAHGGRITVESQPGQGALFQVELPWSVPPSAPTR